ncbi:MAG: shikimate dehydrogenase [Phycisphaerae bacterium]|jgi:3-dehydroquinate dehydratase/shikimate dehydrogenase
MTYLAIPISAKDINSCKEQIKTACAAGAEALELRTDYIEGLNTDKLAEVVSAARQTKLPVVVTCRDTREGGQNNLPPAFRIEILAKAVELGADFIDCEYENFKHGDFACEIKKTLAENSRTKLIISAHNFKNKFENLAQVYEQIFTLCPAAVAKTAYQANHINDCFEAFDILKKHGKKTIAICMGKAGVISRIIAKKLDAFMTFASVEAGSATAPGQLTSEQMKSYRFDIIDSVTEFFGVIGDPVAHSMSPAVHNACFAAEKMNRVYLPVLVAGGQTDFNEFMDNITSRPYLDFKGFSITIPHKTSTLEYAREKGEHIEPLAIKIGAANTLTIGINERINAYNTDYAGAMDALTNAMGITRKQLHGKTVAVVGAGGAARAIIAGLVDVGAKVIIYNRTISRAHNLALEFGCRSDDLAGIKNLDAQIIINCTSIGMHPEVNASPVPAQCLKSSMTVFDTVYNPMETLLLRQAKQAGAKTISGVEMFINQAGEQFKLFTHPHTDCPMETLRKATLEKLMNK